MEKIKKQSFRVKKLFFPWIENITRFSLYGQGYTSAFCKLFFLSKQKWSKRAIWKQIVYQELKRNPPFLTKRFKHVLRVCLTYRCNLSCKHCYARGLQKEISNDMTLEAFTKLICWAKDKGWRCIRFLGGEPTIHPQFREMLDVCYRTHMFITISSNSLFSPLVLSNLKNQWIVDFSINYNSSEILDEKKLSLFKDNLKQLKKRKIHFGFSYILDNENKDLANFIDDIKFFRPTYIKLSLALPNFSSQTSISSIFKDTKSLFDKLIKLQEICIQTNAPFYCYRPIPLCMFSEEEWRQLRGIFPFVAFTRCPIGYEGDYGIMVTVNPDLSAFPCTSIFIKSRNILAFKNRKEISQFFQKGIEELLLTPLAELCKSCPAHKDFLASFKNIAAQNSLSFFDTKICQGGCLNFRWHFQSLCCPE